MERLKSIIDRDGAKLAFCVGSIIGTLLVYGVLQERIIRSPYGEEKEFFKYTLFIVFMNRLLTTAVSAVILVLQKKPVAPVAPPYKYGAISLSNVVATTCQYEALKYVSFPVQTLAKSGKMIPVMIWGGCILKKAYSAKDYAVTLVVTLGCATFFLTARDATSAANDRSSSFVGILLMAGYLAFDGFTSVFQDKLFKGYDMDTFDQVLYVTLCSCALSMIGLVAQGQLYMAINFILRHPECLLDIVVLSLAATTSQFFISFTIRTFGSLIFATVMTTRQLVSIVFSCILFSHPLTTGQLVGAGLVFCTLYFKSYAALIKSRETSSTLRDISELGRADRKAQQVTVDVQ